MSSKRTLQLFSLDPAGEGSPLLQGLFVVDGPAHLFVDREEAKTGDHQLDGEEDRGGSIAGGVALLLCLVEGKDLAQKAGQKIVQPVDDGQSQ